MPCRLCAYIPESRQSHVFANRVDKGKTGTDQFVLRQDTIVLCISRSRGFRVTSLQSNSPEIRSFAKLVPTQTVPPGQGSPTQCFHVPRMKPLEDQQMNLRRYTTLMIEAENDSHLEQSVERQRWQVSTSVDSGHAACPTAEGPPPSEPEVEAGALVGKAWRNAFILPGASD